MVADRDFIKIYKNLHQLRDRHIDLIKENPQSLSAFCKSKGVLFGPIDDRRYDFYIEYKNIKIESRHIRVYPYKRKFFFWKVLDKKKCIELNEGYGDFQLRGRIQRNNEEYALNTLHFKDELFQYLLNIIKELEANLTACELFNKSKNSDGAKLISNVIGK